MYGSVNREFCHYARMAVTALQKFNIVEKVKEGKPSHPSLWRIAPGGSVLPDRCTSRKKRKSVAKMDQE
jgi:hypothetical protein